MVGERDGWQCCYCRVALTLETSTLEHVIPAALGGTNAYSNLKLACEPCNWERGQALGGCGRHARPRRPARQARANQRDRALRRRGLAS